MQARQFIGGYSEAPPSTVGSVLVQDMGSGGQYCAVDTATVHFAPIPDSVIEQLIQEGTVFACAGTATFVSPALCIWALNASHISALRMNPIKEAEIMLLSHQARLIRTELLQFVCIILQILLRRWFDD